MATYSCIFAWRIPRREESGRLQSMGSYELDTTAGTCAHTHSHEIIPDRMTLVHLGTTRPSSEPDPVDSAGHMNHSDS